MKYLSLLLFLFLFAACLQSPDEGAYQTQSYTFETDDNSGAEAPPYSTPENNTWRYDIPMPGNTFANTHAASLKGNGANAWIKLVNGKDLNMAVLQLEDIKFFDTSMVQEILIKFDTAQPKMYTCVIDPLLKFLVIEPHKEFLKKIKRSHTVTIEALIQKTIYKTEVRYENYKSYRSSYSRGRRRTKTSGKSVPITTRSKEVKAVSQTWVFNALGLVWKY